jgi:uncharacterized membrane protein YgcG
VSTGSTASSPVRSVASCLMNCYAYRRANRLGPELGPGRCELDGHRRVQGPARWSATSSGNPLDERRRCIDSRVLIWQQSRAGSEFLCKRARSRYWTDSGATLLSPLTLMFIGLAFLTFVIVAVRSPSTALFPLFTVIGRGSGGSMGAGGFSGGGGRSGGGGATGRW